MVRHRVLLVLDDCGAGDAMRVGFCIRAVRDSLPDSHLTLVVGEDAAAAYRSSTVVDQLVVSSLYRHPSRGRLRKLVELVRIVRATGVSYDVVIVLWWGSTLLRLLARLAGSRTRVGYGSGHGWLLSSELGPYDFDGDEIAQNRRLLTSAGIADVAEPAPMIAISDQDHAAAGAALRQTGWDGIRPLVVLHPGSDWACQQWPADRWASLADGLAVDRTLYIVLTGSRSEEALVESIRQSMTGASASLAGKVTLPELGAVVRRAALVITVDSAVNVLARAEGTATVVLAGPSHPERLGGSGIPPLIVKKMTAEMERSINDCKRPRYPAGGCQDWTCPMAGLSEIAVDEALKAARLALSRGTGTLNMPSQVAAEAHPRSAAEVALPRSSGAGRLLRNIVFLAGGQLASWAFGLLWLIFVPRRLGPAPIGEFVIALAITALLGNVINQGAGTLLMREIARDHTRAPRLVGGTMVMRLACVIPAFIFMLAYIKLLHFGGEQSLIIFLATGVTVTATLSGAIQAAFTGLERMEYLAYGALVGNGLISLFGIAVVLMGGGIVALLLLDLALTVLLLGLNLYWSRRLFRIEWREGARQIRYIVRSGLSYWIGGLFFITYLWIDSVLLSALAPVTVIGWYGVPVQLFTAVLMVAGVLGTAWFPRLAAAHTTGAKELQSAGRPAVETAVVLSLPIAAGLALVSGPLIQVLYGQPFSGAAPVLAILGWTVVPTFFNMLAYQVLLAQGRVPAWIKVVAIATVLNIVANLILIPVFQARGNGAIGSAVSLLATEVFESAGAIVLLPWLVQVRLLSRLARTALATAGMGLAVLAVARFGLVAEIVTGLVVFAVLALVLRLPTRDEIAELRGLTDRLPARFRLSRAAA